MKQLFSGVNIQGLGANAVYLVSRVGLGLMMAFCHGLGKLPPSERLIGGVTSVGFPMPVVFAWAAGLAEFAGALFVALGLATRFSAATVAFTMFVAGFMVHANDPFDKKEFALVYMCAFLIFAALGGGKFSVDALIRKGRG